MKRSIGAKPVLYPTPTLVVGTYDAQGKANVMTAAWGGICCSKPPCVAVSLRAATYSHGNIVARGAFTVSVPSRDHVREVDYFGVASGRDQDKFSQAGLTATASEVVDAPYVAEFPLILQCSLLKQVEIGLHTQFIGEIVEILAEEDCLDERGRVDVLKLRPFVYAPENMSYFALGENLGQAFSIGKELRGD